MSTSGIYNYNVAATTGGRNGATLLVAPYNTVTTTPLLGGVILSASSNAGLKIQVINSGANTLTVYAPDGCTIDGGASTTIPRGGSYDFHCLEGDTNWRSAKVVDVALLKLSLGIL